jgi:hypothetical protein
MTVDEIIHLIRTQPKSHKLSIIQELVLRQTWEGQTYAEMAVTLHYGEDYLKKVAFRLWPLLSDFFDIPISKKTLRLILEKRTLTPQEQKEIANRNNKPVAIDLLEFPNRPVPLDSSLYIERSPIEAQTKAAIAQPGSLIRLKAPRQMGKTSLMLRILAHAQQQGYQTVSLNLRQADSQLFDDLDRFLQWFCAAIARKLKIPFPVDECWSEIYGSKSNCTAYFEEYILAETHKPLVLALDWLDAIFPHPDIAAEFFSLLRSWYEEATYGEMGNECWQSLRLIIVHSTEVYLPLETNRSPFNVGVASELQPFSRSQVEILAERHGLHLSPQQFEELMSLLGGHPYLVRLAFYHLAIGDMMWTELIQTAATDSGIYRPLLHQHRANLQAHRDLAVAYDCLLSSAEPIDLEPILRFKLNSMGLASLQGNAVFASCELYRQYFGDRVV